MGKMISEDRLRELYNIYIRNQSVSTDSRSAPPDSIFFALKGDNFDGNRFVAQALAAGAAIAVGDDPVAAATAAGQQDKDGTLFVVQDAP